MMIKVFKLFQPQQIARYVKAFHSGIFFIEEQGPYHFENGTVSYEQHHCTRSLKSIAEINRQVRDLRQFRP